jgi:hypothetical protein
MGHLERGEKNISFGSTLRVANALGVTLSELFAGLETGETSTAGKSARLKNSSRLRNPSVRKGLDRDQVVKALASLERGVNALREITITQTQQLKPRVHKTQRRGDPTLQP